MRFLVLLGILLLAKCSGSGPVIVTKCEQVTTQFDCDYHAYDQKHCRWQSNKCQGVSQCSDITTQPGCVRAPLSFSGCNWDPNLKACYKPTQGDCMLATTQAACANNPSCIWTAGSPGSCNVITQCGQISAQVVCDDSIVGTTPCQWNQNITQCVAITDCASIVTQAKCNQKELNYNSQIQYCQWTGTCGKITQCLDAVTEVDCNFVNGVFTGGCKWEASITKCVIKDPTQCSQILDSATCIASNLGCQWASNTCSPKPTACTDFTTQTACQNSTSPACYWAGTACAAITACTQINNQALCNTPPSGLSCGWHTWSVKNPGDNIAIPNGVSAGQACGIASTNSCADMVDPVNQCASSIAPQCYWPTNRATPTACTGDTRTCVDAPGVCSGNTFDSCQSGHPECHYEIMGGFCTLIAPCAGQTRSDCFVRTNICLWQ